MKLILIGFMGSGKTSVGQELSKKLNLKYIDLDLEIIDLSEQKNIPKIFVELGEAGFRKLETQALKNTLKQDSFVLATGGGVVVTQENRELLKDLDLMVVFLETNFSVLKDRIGEDPNRPLFQDILKAQDLFEARKEYYANLADFTINTDSLNVSEIVNKILNLLK